MSDNAVEVLRKEISERNGNIAMLVGNIDVKDLNELKLIRDSMKKALLALEEKEELRLAKQCIDFKGIKCENKDCLNKICPLKEVLENGK